jgi:hypothetical protein
MKSNIILLASMASAFVASQTHAVPRSSAIIVNEGPQRTASKYAGGAIIENANDLGDLNIALITEAVIEALTPELWFLNMAFADFSNEVPQAGAESVTVHVPGSFTYGSVADGWTFTDVTATPIVVPLDKERGHAHQFKDSELANAKMSEAMMKKLFIDPAVEGLVADFQAQISALWTLANYANRTTWATAAAATYAATVDLKTALGTRKVKKMNRFLMLNPAYQGALLKDADVKAVIQANDRSVRDDGMLGRLAGFDLIESTEIPTNSTTDLIGVAGHIYGQVIAARAIAQPKLSKAVIENAVHPSGLPFQIRYWYDETAKKTCLGIQYNGGCVKGLTAATQLILSADA